jgi:hypothetical protein
MAGGLDGLPVSTGDTKVVFDQYGNLFMTYLTAEAQSAVVVALSTDGGQSFRVLETFSDPGGTDQPSVAVGPGPGGKDGSVWVTFVLLSDSNIVAAGASVSGAAPGLVGSFNELQAGPGPDGGPTRNFGDVAVGPQGQVLIAYQAPTGDAGPSQVFVNLNANGLQPGGFGPPIVVTATNVGGFDPVPPQATRDIDAEANLAWDLTNGPHHGRLYLAYTDAPAVGSPDTNIFVRFSDDNGKTWSDPVRVNDDTGSATQLLPSVAVDPTSGDVGVTWYDARNDPGDVKTQIFAAISSDGGLTFSRNAPVSLGTSDATDPLLSTYGRQLQYGDYTGLVFQGGILYPAWADNSRELGFNPDQPQFDLAAARAPTAHVSDLPLTATALDITADVNDEGEAFTADLATFTDADPNAPTDASGAAAMYTATIDWGDKTDPATGTIKIVRGKFVVSGTHAYEEEGPHTITITIKDKAGASVVVTNVADVADGKLTAQGQNLKPVENQIFHGAVSSFTDSDPNGQPNDYAAQINWGDGTQTRGSVAFSGSAALTWDGFASSFFAIGNSDNLTVISPTGVVTNVAALDPSFHRGGLTVDTTNGVLYAISNTDAGVSTLNAFDPASRTFQPVLRLGTGFTGGLAYDANDGNFYAIADDGASSSLYQINLGAGTVAAVADLGPLSQAFFAGLTFDPFDGHLYAAGNDSDGASTLYQITPGGALPVVPLFSLGTGFTGGLAVATGAFAGALRGEIVGIAGDGSGSAVLNTISLSGPVTAVFEVGANFNDGFDVVGTHQFGEEATLPVDVSITDAGGSAVTAHSSATVVDSAPELLTPPLAITALQGVSTGTLELAKFLVPGGVETGPNEYTATINWNDGSPTQEAGGLSLVGSIITVTGGHTFPDRGTFEAATVTLTDDTGNSVTVPLMATIEPDVTDRVRAVGSGLVFNPATQHFVGDLNVTSTIGIDIPGPFYVVVDSLPFGVTLVDAPAMTADGNPLFTINVPALSVGASLPTIPLEFSDPSLVPISYRVRVIDGPGGAAPAAATSDQIVVTDIPIAAVEGAEFSGAVASFLVPPSQPQQGFSATIDWGDGTVTPGTILSLTPGVFDVVGTHTWQRNGLYRMPIVVRDASGAEFSAVTSPADASVVGSVTYHVTLDTATLLGKAGFLSFQFNPGALPGSPVAAAHVTQFVAHNATLLAATRDGVSSGDLTTEMILGAGDVLNRLTEQIQFGDKIEFDVTIDGAGIAAPALGLFGDVFAVQLLAADGVTALLSANKSAATLKIDLEPDGTTQSHAFPPDTAGSPTVARAAAFDGALIRDAAVNALQVPFSGVEGNDFSGVVATFTSANPFETAADFTAAVNWTDGTPTTAGVITADPTHHLFVVTATHRYRVPGDYAFSVTISEGDGLTVQAALPSGAPELLAGRRTFTGARETSGQLQAIGDFNHDGFLDIAIPSGNTTTPPGVIMMLGTGDGSFRVTTLPGAANQVVAADFNNDGFLDLAVAPATADPIAIYLGNGDGTFQPPVAGPATLGGVYALQVADLNHDGKMDLVASTGGNNAQGFVSSGASFSVLLGRGDGTFDYTPSRDTYFLPHSSLHVADMNSDGNQDVVAIDSANNVLRVLPGLGDGTLSRDANLQPLTVNTAIPAGATLATIADLNGDGKLDMAVTGTDYVSILLGNGNGTFKPPTSYNAPAAYDVIAADYNGDGLPDLVVTNTGDRQGLSNLDRGNLYVLLNVGNGNFAPAVPITGTGAPMHLAAGDFNGDGRTDVFLTSQFGYANVLLGAGDGSFLTARRYETGLAVNPNLGQALEGARAADVNGDGIPDLILLEADNFGRVDVALGNGDGTFQAMRSFPLGLSGVPSEVAFGDINGDGKVDLVVASPSDSTVSILLGNGDGTFQPRLILSPGVAPTDIVLTDINKDGKLDLVLGVFDTGARILLGNGDGTFQNPVSVALPGSSVRIVVRDFNGDGNLDLAALQPGAVHNFSEDNSQIYVALNRGDGTFLPAVTYSTSSAAWSMTSGDVNGDGIPDLITGSNSTVFGNNSTLVGGSINVLLGLRDGTFQPAVRYGTYPSGYTDVITADINGDGHLDIIAAGANATSLGLAGNVNEQGVAVLRNKGDGTFDAPTFYDNAGVIGIGKIAVADFNGDHVPDILTANSYDNTFSILFSARGRGHAGASISEAAIAVTGADLHLVAGLSFTAAAASFSDANSFSVPGDFTANIDWGDGQTSPGTIGANPLGGFDVIGTHVYAVSGKYVTTITVGETGAGTQQATGAIIINAPPVAANDTVGTNLNTAVLINVLANDSDPDGTVDPTTVTIVSTASHGTTSVNAITGAVTYTPALNYTGPDNFAYKVKDNLGADSNVATVTITVKGPVAGTITGAAFLDVTGNGLTSDDTPLPGMQVYIDTNNNGSLNSGEPVTTTLANGTYAFTGLAAGTYTIREVVPTGYVRTAPVLSDHDTVTVGIGQTSSGNNFAIAQPGDKSVLTNVVYVINGTAAVSDLHGATKEGDTVQVSFTVVPGVLPHRFTLVGYTAPGSTFDANTAAKQKIFETDTGIFGAGTWTLTVSVPHSYYQIDFVSGYAIDHFGPAGSNIFYNVQNRVFSGDNSGTHAVNVAGAALSGAVYLDGNNNGAFDAGERPIAGVTVTASGCSMTQTVVTNPYGVYTFDNLPAGAYTITETQPRDYTNGKDTLGNRHGSMTNDKFTGIILAAGDSGTGYNFGEQQTVGSAVAGNQTQSIAWWNGSAGQALIKAINGSQNARNLGNWLAATFNNMFGANAGTANNLAGKTSTQVAAYCQTIYANSARKPEAEALALALDVYVTDTRLAGNVGTSYGFAVSTIGLGAATVNVGVSGPAFGINNNTVMTITELLSRTNARARKGVVWDANGDGASSAAESILRKQAWSLFNMINNT